MCSLFVFLERLKVPRPLVNRRWPRWKIADRNSINPLVSHSGPVLKPVRPVLKRVPFVGIVKPAPNETGTVFPQACVAASWAPSEARS